MAKKTKEQLEAQIQATEARLKQQKEDLEKITTAELKKQNAEIIKAVDEWNASKHKPTPREELPKLFRSWASNNRAKAASQSAPPFVERSSALDLTQHSEL